MAADEVLIDAVERGYLASGSEREREDLFRVLSVFKDALLREIHADDTAGVMALSYTIRDGKNLGAGVILTLDDRVLFGWMKGLLKKPVIEAIPLSSITGVEQGVRPASGRLRENRTITIRAASEWEMICSPDVPDGAPLYGLLTDLLSGKVKADQLPDLESQWKEPH
ncbi:MAG TPA: hypothetical protein VFM94_00100 [Solirubrobacterales bacterium]|nr:hypothetical protein [Solirubrobacterales bacterium]